MLLAELNVECVGTASISYEAVGRYSIPGTVVYRHIDVENGCASASFAPL
jgi:hypothetical protein